MHVESGLMMSFLLRSLSLQVFSLPKVSAKTKFKLTAHEGCRVRKVALVLFSSTAQEDYSEHTLVCLTNLGDMHLFNIPGLRPQVGTVCVLEKCHLDNKRDCVCILGVFTVTVQHYLHIRQLAI